MLGLGLVCCEQGCSRVKRVKREGIGVLGRVCLEDREEERASSAPVSCRVMSMSVEARMKEGAYVSRKLAPMPCQRSYAIQSNERVLLLGRACSAPSL